MGNQGLPPGVDISQLADWPTRALGWLVDAIPFIGIWVIFYIISFAIGFFISLLGDLCALAVGIFLAYQLGTFGSTPGMRLIGLKCVSVKTGQPLGFGMGIVRAIIHWIAFVLCIIPGVVDLLFPLWDGHKQTLADKLISSVVIKAPKEPFSVMPKTS
jgi:uncharacterized RDD family membrane protein YckC